MNLGNELNKIEFKQQDFHSFTFSPHKFEYKSKTIRLSSTKKKENEVTLLQIRMRKNWLKTKQIK